MFKVPQSELKSRMSRFRGRMDASAPDWEAAVVVSKINMFYFAGTMQDGMLIIPRAGEAELWVRKSYERALDESLFPVIKPMESYRDAAAAVTLPAAVHLETETVPLAMYSRLQRYFPITQVKPLEPHLAAVRAVKSQYELNLTIQSGEIHRRVLEDIVPGMLKAGMSEAELSADIFTILIAQGHHGVARFGMFDTEIPIGQIGFGESSLYPSYFNGPGGHRGLSAAAPFLGSRERKLAPGDLVFVDIGCGVNGYHSDKTTTYMFGKPIPQDAVAAHHRCVDIQNEIAAMLVPGEIPARIYKKVMAGIDQAFMQDFMGYGSRRVKFLGHGVGLQIDETPVLAEGFNEPLTEGMVIAVEPKKGMGGVGMVGIENTFLVAEGGGRCITGGNPGLIEVY